MPFIQRVQAILLRPRETWPVIAAEPADAASIYSGYVVFLAAIPAIAGFIGLSLIGFDRFGLDIRIPIFSGLVRMALKFVLSLAMVYVLALLVDALAPTFGGTRNRIGALKLVAYGCTAGFVGGIFTLLPMLSILCVFAAIYSIYLIYTGLPVLMNCPPGKAGGYTAVVIVCGLAAGLVLGGLMTLVAPRGQLHMGRMARSMGPDGVTITTPSGEVAINGSGIGEMARRMEEVGKRIEAAQKSGDGATAGKAASDAVGALPGSGGAPIASQELKAMLPDAIGDLKRVSVEAQGGQVMGLGGSTAEASYAAGERRIRLSITDMGSLGGLAMMAGAADVTVDRETDAKIEKVYKDGARTVHEAFRKDGSHGDLTTILGNGVVVEASGDQIDMPSLKKVVAGIDLAKIEALKRAAKP